MMNYVQIIQFKVTVTYLRDEPYAIWDIILCKSANNHNLIILNELVEQVYLPKPVQK